MRKSLVVSVVVALLVGIVVAAPVADAGAKRKACKKVKVATPDSFSTDPSGALKAKVVKVTEKATEKKPLQIDFSHAPALADSILPEYPAEDPVFFNFQIDSKSKTSILHLKIEWPAPSPSDIDLFLYEASSGVLIDGSVSYNPIALEALNTIFGGDDANGLEQIRDIGLERCYGFTVESRPASSPGESAMKLSVWLS